MSEVDFRKRNRLPLTEYVGPKVYSLTLACGARASWFSDTEVVEQCFSVLRVEAARAGMEIYAFCFMPDHLHLLVGSLDRSVDLIEFVKRFKQQTGWWFRTAGRGSLKASPTRARTRAGLWQKSYYDHVIRSDENLRVAAEYVLANPVRAGLSNQIGDFPYAGSLVWEDWIPAALKQ